MRHTGRAVATLCFLFLTTTSVDLAIAADAPATVNVVTIQSASWDSDLVVSEASEGATLRTTSAKFGTSSDTLTFHDGGAAIVKNIRAKQEPNGYEWGLTRLSTTGSLKVATEATFKDSYGNFNTVYIPALTTSLPANAERSAHLNFSRIENQDGARKTFFALMADSPTSLTLKFFDPNVSNFVPVGTEVVSATPATFYEALTQMPIGRVEIYAGTPGFGCGGCNASSEVFAVAFVGYRQGGSPRAELPTLTTGVTQ